jgi:hypothetical protein
MRFWNLLHYCIYELQLNFHKLFRFISPIYYLYKVPLIKRYFEKKYGTDDMAQYVDDAVFDDPRSGQTIVWAGIQMGVIMISIQIIIFNIVQAAIGENLNNYIFDNEKYKLVFILALVTIAGIVNYNVLFKDKKYLLYFEDFNKISRRTITLYSILILLGYIALIISTIASFALLKFV